MALTDAITRVRAGSPPRAEVAARARSQWLLRIGWLGAATCAAVVVVVGQVANRPPLVWDEGVRVGSGERLNMALRSNDLGQVWSWFKDQTLYPFLEPALHGLVLRVGGSPLLAAWLPSTLAFAATGLLAAALVRQLGGNRVAIGLAAALVWLCPINARVAGGAFTDNLGACVLLGVVLVLVRLTRRLSWRDAVILGVLVGCAWALKYPYGILATVTVVASAVATMTRSRRRLAIFAAVLAVGALLGAAFLVPNWHERWADFSYWSNQPGRGNVDFGYYLGALFREPQIAFEPAVAVTCVLGLVLLVGAWRARPEFRPAVVAIATWLVMYSVVRTKIPRLTALVLPLALAAAVAGFSELHGRLARRVPREPLAVLTGWCVVLLVAQLAMQAPRLGDRFEYLEPNGPAEAAAAFVESHLPSDGSPLVLLGVSNQLGPHAVQLAWDRQLQERSPGVYTVPEFEPRVRKAYMVGALRFYQPSRIIGIDIKPGSRFDAEDYRANFGSHPDYIRYARQLERDGALRRVASTTLDRGRLEVMAWEPSPDAEWVTAAD